MKLSKPIVKKSANDRALPAKMWRFGILYVFVAALLFVTVWRLVDLSFISRSFLVKQADARIVRKIKMPAFRGMIVDRQNQPLAISTPVITAWLNPKDFSANQNQLSNLSHLLHMPVSKILAKANINKREFVYLKRRMSPQLEPKLKALKIKGLYFDQEYKRFYPSGEVSAQVLGLTNIDDRGIEGLELAYNNWLQGENGLREVIKDRKGHIIATTGVLKKPNEGKKLQLSIDNRLQYVAYHQLQNDLKKFDAEAASVVVEDIQTGEVLAMVNLPSFNPNARQKNDFGQLRNRAVTDAFEPGSTIKAFNVAIALESQKYNPKTLIKTSPGWMMVGGHAIHDTHDHGTITLTQLLQLSSNVGAAKVMLSLDPQNYWNLLKRVGFGERPNVGFPGESSGSLIYHNHWTPSETASLAFGYTLSVTTMQLADAYAVIADHGMRKAPTLLLQDKKVVSQQVMDPVIAKTIAKMMESVVTKDGTGFHARVNGFRVAGKTGTAYIAGKGGYDKKHYMASFVGFAPASRPRYVVAVNVKNPKKLSHFGGTVAGPVFAKVMAAALRLNNIAPDGSS